MLGTILRTSLITRTGGRSIMSVEKSGQTLSAVVAQLEKFAPARTAEKWDNVGLLLEPYKEKPIKKILLTNDLTAHVLNEAVDKSIDMIISYHPPIFKPLTRLTQHQWKERIITACIYHSIAVYSPHTAWDKINGGVNDWLAQALPIKDLRPLLEDGGDDRPGCGVGRIFTTTVTIAEGVSRLQKHIDNHVHVALACNHNLNTEVRTVALCAGSGASVLRGVEADLIITGEMSHHEVLDFNHNGGTVLLCNHSNSERGFLAQFQPDLDRLLDGKCEIKLSEADRDPLTTFVKAID